ncbi:MAG: hypothetical protein IT306_08810 [Chloroflexi bacterium]|nr:hypothetical protein [Chloroflexota bacterium]
MKRIRFGLLAAGLALLAGTTLMTGSQPAAAQTASHVTMTLNEWSIISDQPAVPAGDVTIDVSNIGEDVHEVIIIKSDLDITALPPSKVRGEVDEEAIGEYIGGFEDVAPAASMSGTLSLAPGRYILLCNLTNHYTKGMVATLTVD